MNISFPFIKKPVMTTLVMLTIVTFGYISYKSLPVSDLPNVDYPTIEVSVSNPGSNPQTMAATCATPLEREFMTIDGINNITSSSTLGSTQLILQFNLNKSMDTASLDVEAAINRANRNLPKDLPFNPVYNKVNPSATPIIYYAISSSNFSLGKLYDYANTNIGQRLSMIDGVSQVLTFGAPYAARIQLNPEKIAAMNLDIDEVSNQITKANVDFPTGTLWGDKNEFTIDVDGQVLNAEGYNEVVIKNSKDSIVKISQIGKALDSTRDDKYYLKYQTKKKSVNCCVLAVQIQPGKNTIEVTNAIKTLLPSITKKLPASLEFHKIFEKAEFINAAVDDVKLTLFIAFLLVVIIIYLYLGKFVNTIIPAIVLPISILGTFAIMHLMHFNLDILSLLAITLSIGFLVDDAIVVLENNVRHVQMGKTPLQATIDGSKEISITIFSITISLVSVFIPLIFMGGIVGKLFKEFALTISVAVLISGFISLSLTPLLCSRLISGYNKNSDKNFVEKFSEKINFLLLKVYKKALKFVLRYKFVSFSFGIGFIIFGAMLFIYLPKEFIPNQDMGFIMGFTESQDGTSPFEMARYQKKITDIVSENKYVESSIGVSSTTSDNEGQLFIRLKPYNKRKGINTIINELMEKTSQVSGVNTYLTILPLINLQPGAVSKGLYQYYLTSLTQETLNENVDKIMNQIKKLDGFTQVSSDLQIKQPQLHFEILRDKASYLNISAAKIENLLMKAYTDKKISTINTDINQYDVIVETLPEYYKDPTVIKKLYIKNDKNKLVPMDEIVNLSEKLGPLSVNHLNGLPSCAISFNLSNIALGPAVSSLDNLAKDILPPTISGKVEGTADVFKKSFKSVTFLFFVSIFVIYIILGILYENFIHPITVMSTLAPAAFGGLFTLFIFNEIFSLYSFVGLIMLIGIVLKNGIILVDFANDYLDKNYSATRAIFKAAIVRFRPIMMTTIAAFMGALPIAIGIGGSSAKSLRGLGLVVVGGLLISQVLTLLLTPVTYILVQNLKDFLTTRILKKV